MLSCPSCGLERATRDGPSCYRADPLPVVARVCAAAGQPEPAGRFLAGADRWLLPAATRPLRGASPC